MSSLLQESDNGIHSRSSCLSKQDQKNALVVAPDCFEDIRLCLRVIARQSRESSSIVFLVSRHLFCIYNTVAEKFMLCR